MTVKVRFAPAPTGRLHVGNIRTAVTNWLFARRHGGQFVLRIDDTDFERSTEGFVEGIRADLTWLGLTWDQEERQSRRAAIHQAAADRLKAMGRLYPAYETQEELDRRRKVQLSRGLPPVYDRAALKLTDEDRAKLEAEGRRPHWRFRLDGKRVAWNDLIRGEAEVDTTSMSDPVLIREDGLFLYTLPSVADDIEVGVTHVIRGEDHVTNTGVQIEIFEALGAVPPQFAHHPLLVGADGQALSKRLGSLSISELRREGYEPIAVTSHLAKIGTSDPLEVAADLEDLRAGFDFAKFGRAPARYDQADLKRLNAQILHGVDYAKVRDELEAADADLGEAFWNAVRANVALVGEAAEWAKVVQGPVTPVVEDADFLARARDLLPAAIDGTTWKSWTEAVKTETGAKGRALFMPLRQAITGLDHGPEMGAMLPLIGRDKIVKRLSGEAG
jgi:glutamyl-tRNA synthetase